MENLCGPVALGWFDRLVVSAGLAAAGAQIPLSVAVTEEEVDEERLQATLKRQLLERVFPIIHAYAKTRGWAWSERTEPQLSLIRTSNAILMEQLETLVRSLNEANVPVMLIKGADLMLSAYPAEIPRMMDDIDILIRPPDLPRAIEIFLDAGYIQGSVDFMNLRIVPAETVDLTSVIAKHYELPPFRKFLRTELFSEERDAVGSIQDEQFVMLGSDIYYLAEYDLHFNVSPHVEVRDLWHDTRRYNLSPDVEVMAPNISDVLWLLGMRGYKRIAQQQPAAVRSFLDIVVLLASKGSEVNWRRLVAITRKYEAQPALFYLLWHARELLGDIVPYWVIEQLYPAAEGVNRIHDAGDVTPRLFHTVRVQPMIQ